MPPLLPSTGRAATRLYAKPLHTQRPTAIAFSTAIASSAASTPGPLEQARIRSCQPRPRCTPPTSIRQTRHYATHQHPPKAHPDSHPPNQTYYDLFPRTLPQGAPPRGPFPIDVRALRREFLQLQARAHPDLHAHEHKTRAQSASARINEAFRTLAHPLARAQYLLSLRGVDVATDESAKVADMELLAEVLEAREEIEEAMSEADLEGPKAVNDGRIKESEKMLERAFAEDDLEGAKREAVRLRYWINIKHCLDEWEQGKPVELHH